MSVITDNLREILMNNLSINGLVFSAQYQTRASSQTDTPAAESTDLVANKPKPQANHSVSQSIQVTQVTYGADGAISGGSISATNAVNSSTEPRNVASSNILRFVDAQIQRDIADGATNEALESRLAAGLEGFLKGFNEAFNQLEHSGLLGDEVLGAIADTYNKVLNGIDQIAEKLGVESPVTETQRKEFSKSEIPEALPISVEAKDSAVPLNLDQQDLAILETIENLNQLHQDSISSQKSKPNEESESTQLSELSAALGLENFNISQSEKRAFEFSMLTRDGDAVNIRLVSGIDEALQSEDGTQFYSVERYGQFSFEVEGDLSEEELRAINDLLNQVGDISESFFGGDLFAAFEQALNIGFDSDQIASFSLNLRREQVTRVDNTYNAIANIDPVNAESVNNFRDTQDNKLVQISQFIEMLEKIREEADSFEIKIEVVVNISTFMAEQKHSDHQALNQFRPIVSDLFEALDRLDKPSSQEG